MLLLADRSDGGLLTTVLEMCFGGDCGCVMETTTESSVMEFLLNEELGLFNEELGLFNEELGLVVEVDDASVLPSTHSIHAKSVMVKTQAANRVKVNVSHMMVLDEDEKALHDLWEVTSLELDKLQSNPACAE